MTFTEDRQHFASILDKAKKGDGEAFYIRPETPKKSPLDIKGIDIDISASEIVDIVREGRDRNYG